MSPASQPRPWTNRRKITTGLLLLASIGVVFSLERCSSGDITDGEGGWIGPVRGEPSVVYEFRHTSGGPDGGHDITLTVWEGTARLVARSDAGVQDVGRRVDEPLWRRTLTASLELGGKADGMPDECPTEVANQLTVFDGDRAAMVEVFGCDHGEDRPIRAAVSGVLDLFDLADLLSPNASISTTQ